MTRARDIANLMSTLGGTDLDTDAGEVVPHIKLDILYPAVAGKDLSGTALGGSYTYGTAHTDGRKYYYTDIKGSKPIKDPRIGAYFGSQRHMFKSLQFLPEETSTHGKNIYSIDGREWIRAYTTSSKNFVMENGSHGEVLLGTDDCAGVTLEIVGFFNNFNMISKTATNQCDDIGVTINGGTERDSADTGKLFGDVTNTSSLGSRYVSAGSVINHGDSNLTTDLGTTPKINTIKITAKTGSSEYVYTYGIELIAQDTTSTANKSKIQIPAQSVVSFGKKHSISATAQHYDPFNGFTNSSHLHSTYVDTATSLGLSTAPGSSASWAISSTNNIRPYNGMRVVKWVDSSGAIKTSVNAVPPNAQNGLSSVAGTTEVTTPSATNTTPTPIFSDDAIDFSTSESSVLHHREFGNGAQNKGTGDTSSPNNAPDVSMLNTNTTADTVSYVMDDGLTSFGGNQWTCNTTNESRGSGNTDSAYITFIGTGFSLTSLIDDPGTHHIASNLPFGTHVLLVKRTGSANTDYVLDGITLTNVTQTSSGIGDIFIHQPKMPPIPEDCVVLADYILYADFVKQTDAEATQVSKGTRAVSSSRDIHYDSSASISSKLSLNPNSGYARAAGVYYHEAGSSTMSAKIPFFGTTGLVHAGNSTATLSLNGTGVSEVYLDNSSSAEGDTVAIADSDEVVLGLNTLEATIAANWNIYGLQVQSPIHTSSHYQFFEGPFTKDLIGGDRNMEQTNLVVKPDGTTWDQLRDTSYIGKGMCITTSWEDGTSYTSSAQTIAWNQWRGKTGSGNASVFDCVQKDWAISHNHLTCLVGGYYRVELTIYMHNASGGKVWYIINKIWDGSGDGWGTEHKSQNQSQDEANINVQYFTFKRGDYLSLYFEGSGSIDNFNQNILRIIRV